MKVKQIKNTEERAILIGMIVDTSVAARIASKWGRRGGLFRSDWSNLVADWCVHYFRKYEKAPRKAIQSHFQRWAQRNPDPDTHKLVESFLTGLSGDYRAAKKETNASYLIDLAARHFTQVKLERLRNTIDEQLELGEVEKASKHVEEFHKIEMGMGSTVKVLTDKESIKRAFAETKESMVQYPGALGRFLSPYLTRDAFIALLGPEKRGKSFWLLDLVFRAMEQRRKVAYFVVGDMSEGQVQMRIGTRAAQLPVNKHKTVRYPVELKHPKVKFGVARVKHVSRRYKKQLSWQKAWKAYQDILLNKVKSKDSYIRMVVVPAGGISVDGIDEQLKLWEQEGWSPDVVVTDYADNLDMPDGGDDPRHQSNAAWKKMRGLSQTWHCLFVTATQANAASYGDEVGTITRKNFSEDKRKLAHVTGMIGLNQNSEEKVKGLYRLNWVLVRDGDYSEWKCVHCASCLALANPAVLSTF
jgi:hypothetical protein